jgi:plastocyanin
MHRCSPLHRSAAWLGAGLLAATAQAAVLDVTVLGSDGRPLGDAVVFLESKDTRAATRPLAGVEIEQAAKQFTHRVSVVTVGTEVAFPNRDKVRHHVYSFSPVKPFELKLYAGTPANPVLFDKAGIAVLGCNIHDNMVAWVVVVETPHHGLSGAPGKVRLDSVPPGNYRLRSWHPALPTGAPALEQPLTLAAAGTALTLRLPVAATP